ncbi:sugar transporter ERD6-like 8 [Contarinia nasturtii]|uniref:sugar transporter ERD6-like 8 n=1 Tax=Contarinia nasturtii TaxID=265458 RepID=UPI0012D3EB91|nr:sugar transporter ERD6-like 8 [Contarinia nasturtii]
MRYGMVVTSPNDLTSNDTPLKTGPISNSELSGIGAMNSVGAIASTFITGIFSAFWGSKRAMTLLAYPAIAFWLLIYFGDSFYHILLARFATGLTGGLLQSGIVLFIAEISDDK